jgi:hypothetical protein
MSARGISSGVSNVAIKPFTAKDAKDAKERQELEKGSRRKPRGPVVALSTGARFWIQPEFWN